MLGDVRGLLMAPATLVLQVAHPVVGAGVEEHSRFREDPWTRLVHTIGSTVRFTYGSDPVALAEADRLRRIHARIAGIDRLGRPYQALEPSAYAWVHLTLAHFALDVQRVLARPLSPSEREVFYGEWRQIGLRLGVADTEMPRSWPAFVDYFATTVRTTLEDNQSVRDVLDVVRHPPPPSRKIPDRLWAPLSSRAGELQTLFTIGTLPLPVRELLGLPWSDDDQRLLQRRAATVRRAFDSLPRPLRTYPQVLPHALAARWWASAPALRWQAVATGLRRSPPGRPRDGWPEHGPRPPGASPPASAG